MTPAGDWLNFTPVVAAGNGAPGRVRLLWGLVASNGTIGQAGGGDWSVAHTGTGLYTVTFGTAFANLPAAIPTPVAANYLMGIFNLATGSVEFFVVDTADVAQDVEFSFMVVGI